ncbi:MAG: stage II sporulation protein P [Clostridiales bacterium]|nr:stage II sporulation protein P [Clostridiales bacterium]MDD6872327.1 stage II sporulation protein P [Clostridiales bacterium]MDD7367288.1 stage II sporulation protein P [Clostridiales bacterium]MDY2871740.1 stage II sporulation protein P [Eubacteriales bacterium]
MVKIKVIHASKLLAAAAAVILAIALIVLAVSASSGAAQGTSGERAAAVAAFSFWRPPKMEFELPGENEHADLIVLEDAAVQEDHTQPVERPRVLIYHTHTHEAYAQTAADPYRETESWRTEDQTHSVVRVGEALAALLTDYGFDVVHDTADYEYPKLNTAYARSLDMLETKRGETFNLCVDLHRDAWDKSMAECACIGSQRAAQLMMLIGNGGNFDIKPDYEANLAFAARLTDRINALCDGLCRPVMVKNGRYNQHLFTPSVLIEVGHNLNTLDEALASMPVLAEALADLLKES